MSDLGKIIPFPSRKLSTRAAAREPAYRQTNWAEVDEKTRARKNKEFPASSILAHLRAMVGK
jgi:hypothetical protein